MYQLYSRRNLSSIVIRFAQSTVVAYAPQYVYAAPAPQYTYAAPHVVAYDANQTYVYAQSTGAAATAYDRINNAQMSLSSFNSQLTATNS